jgi:aspartate aminotransferase-like enzyme
MPRFYWDFSAAKRYLARGQTPWTPAVSVLFALAESLAMMEAEGHAQVVARHKRVGARMRAHVRALGLELFPREEKWASDTVTAVRVPDGVDVSELRRILRDDHAVVVAGGQAQLAGKVFRIGHLGWVDEADVDRVGAALREALPRAARAK